MLESVLLKEFQKTPGIPSKALEMIENDLEILLPDEYKEFLSTSNGGEGFIGPNSYLRLWDVRELKALNEDYQVSEYLPGFLLIGSNGGGDAYALSPIAQPGAVFETPFVGMCPEDTSKVADGFESFLKELFKRE